MGAVKSVTHSYSYGEYLLYHIERNDIPNVEKVLEKRPDLIDSNNFTANAKTTPLHRAAINGNLELAKLLLEKYHANVDGRTSNGETPLIGAVKKNKLEMVRLLLVFNANPNEVSGSGLKPVDYAILNGFYDIALVLYERMEGQELKEVFDYEMLGTKHHYRYVNYRVFLEHLKLKTQQENVPNFLTKPKPQFDDPVVDPRETWKHWILRNLQFKDPPLCQRSDLPPELQPQNRRFGKLSHMISNMAMTHMSQRTSYMPQSQSHTEAKIGKCTMKEQEDAQSIQSI